MHNDTLSFSDSNKTSNEEEDKVCTWEQVQNILEYRFVFNWIWSLYDYCEVLRELVDRRTLTPIYGREERMIIYAFKDGLLRNKKKWKSDTNIETHGHELMCDDSYAAVAMVTSIRLLLDSNRFDDLGQVYQNRLLVFTAACIISINEEAL